MEGYDRVGRLFEPSVLDSMPHLPRCPLNLLWPSADPHPLAAYGIRYWPTVCPRVLSHYSAGRAPPNTYGHRSSKDVRREAPDGRVLGGGVLYWRGTPVKAVACKAWQHSRRGRHGTYKTVKARAWPWRSGKYLYTLSRCTRFALRKLIKCLR